MITWLSLREPQWWKQCIQDPLDFFEGSIMLIMNLVTRFWWIFWGEILSAKIHLHTYATRNKHLLQTISWTKNYTLRMSVLECWTYTLQQSHKTCISGTKASLWPLSLPNSTQWPNADRWLHPVQAYLSSSNWMASSKPFNRHWTTSLMGMR